ncbi:NepR family anti-sigma factor [Microvirga subterranea]|uniref:Anti-sigma factor NepR domain-containing protein n=1 Tax=Microvirga subterranea TaxID=186651 RepID=A0A370H7E4_9HYPH|nr:hypothetical protein DES45_11466 [Microvirga subterranea]
MLTTSVRLTGRRLNQGGSSRTRLRRKTSDRPSLSPEVSACLGERLRASYKEMMRDPTPDRFIRILESLNAKEKSE